MNRSTDKSVSCFGEVLWDIFPEHENIGGAPLNVALRIHSFGIPINFISKIGKDTHGDGILNYLKDSGIDPKNIQTDTQLPTGIVQVALDEQGSATYEIVHPVAWDAIELKQNDITAIKNSNVFVFGSLVCRDQRSKLTLFSLLKEANIKVFDVNLRPPFYSLELLEDLMLQSDFIKCNDEELDEICTHFQIPSNDRKKQIEELAHRTKSTQVCVTLGAQGALLYIEGAFYHHSGYSVVVKDTVGAGDSFLGTLISKLLIEQRAPSEALSYACAMGALVASKEGANPTISSSEIEALQHQ